MAMARPTPMPTITAPRMSRNPSGWAWAISSGAVAAARAKPSLSEMSVRKPPVAVIAVTVAACLALAYGAISEAASAFLRDRDPEIAVAVNPADAASRAVLAQAQVNEALTQSE